MCQKTDAVSNSLVSYPTNGWIYAVLMFRRNGLSIEIRETLSGTYLYTLKRRSVLKSTHERQRPNTQSSESNGDPVAECSLVRAH